MHASNSSARGSARAWSVVRGTLLFASFVVVTASVLLAANGFRVNTVSGTVEQLAAIVLRGEPEAVTITLDGVDVATRLPATLRSVVPGTRHVRVVAEGYHDWYAAPRLWPGQAAVYDTIQLFLQEPVLLVRGSLPSTLPPVIDPLLVVEANELYQLRGTERSLVTRFSQPILAAQLSIDRSHVFLQLGTAIYVTELDGSNTTRLMNLSQATPSPLMPSDSDQILGVVNNGMLEQWKIR